MNLKHRKQLNHLLTENWKKNVNTQVLHEIRLLYEIDYNMIWKMNIICWKLLASWLVGRIFSLVKVIVCPITSTLLKEFLTLKGESRAVEEIAQDELNSFIITVRKKEENEDYEPIHCVVC